MKLSKTLAACLCLLQLGALPAFGQNALELLAGFDRERLEQTHPLEDREAVANLSKLLYRLNQLQLESLRDRIDEGGTKSASVGDAVRIAGNVRTRRSLAVPAELADYLGFERIDEFSLTSRDGEDGASATGVLRVYTIGLPTNVTEGDLLEGVGVLLDPRPSDQSAAVAAASSLAWYPTQAVVEGWELLGRMGFDAALLPGLASRQRQALTAEDSEAFYAMLAATQKLRNNASELPVPKRLTPLEMLREPKQHVGQWMTMPLETVRVTRISLRDQPRRMQQLGQDHYFQIDAIGGLGKVQLQIERPDGEPVIFENRYPVSIVTPELPEFLRAEIERRQGPGAVSASVSVPVQVGGFFFRLWSYESQFMEQHGGGNQFGPLLVGTTFENLAVAGQDPAGVSRIGWYVAAGVLAAIVLAAGWSWRNARRDAKIRQQRRDVEAERLEWPADTGR